MRFENAKEMYNEIINNNDEIYTKWYEAIEERRKNIIIATIVSIIMDIIILYISLKDVNSDTIFLNGFNIYTIVTMIIVDIIIYAISFIFGKKKKEFNREFKKNIINKIISNFYNNLEYLPEKGMSSIIYNEPQYENENYNKYYSEDYIEATIDNKYKIMMAEVLTQREQTYTDSDGDTHTSTTTLFHGLFAKIDMNKSINSNLVIEPNNILNKLNLFRKNKLEMDSRRI